MSTTSESVPASYQPHSAERVEAAARWPNLLFSVEVARCVADADLVMIAVNTPTKSTGVGAGIAMDMTAFEAVVIEIAQYARAGAIIVEKSTVPCRTAEHVRAIVASRRPGVHFEILSNPEFLAAGTAVRNLLHPDRVLIGSSATPSGRRAAGALFDVYAAWVPSTRIIMTNIWSSELSKLVANAMLAQRISSINSISAICEATGADIDEVATAIGCDPRIGDKFLKAGIGFRGNCFKKDILSLVYLADSLGLGYVGDYWRQVIIMNELQRDRFSRRVVQCLNGTLVGKKITLLGFTFKANTSDTREPPTLDIVRTLLEEKPAEVAIFDPCCNPAIVRRETALVFRNEGVASEGNNPVAVYSDVYEACHQSNAILIMTECDEFRDSGTEVLPLPGQASGEPRLLEQHGLSETDILVLHEFLCCSPPLSGTGPLWRYGEEPPCSEDCPECALVRAGHGHAHGYRAGNKVDWHKVAYHMKNPKWLFDGKGIISPEKMAMLGFHVESIGRQGRR